MPPLSAQDGYIEPKRPFRSGMPYPPEYRPTTIKLPDSRLNELRTSLANDEVALNRKKVELAHISHDEKRKDREYANLFYTVALKRELLAARSVDTTKFRGKLYIENNGWLDSLSFDEVCRKVSDFCEEDDSKVAA
ncbi:hypothetical protein HZA43_06175 [Candidatus Peregrinibacteria bacterium]|nr:hypothetical protein [Candidatus Peregrinibacteria bacterium]